MEWRRVCNGSRGGILESAYEFGGYGAVESDYREPRTYNEMMKRPEGKRMKW